MATNPGIPELHVTGPVRALVPGLFALAALCFFLPFLVLNCWHVRVASSSGMGMIAGLPPAPDEAGLAELQQWKEIEGLAASLITHWVGDGTAEMATKRLDELAGPQAAEQVRAMLSGGGSRRAGHPAATSSPWFAIIAFASALAGALLAFLRFRREAATWMVLALIGLAALWCMPVEPLNMERALEAENVGTPIKFGLHAARGIGHVGASIAFALAGILAFFRPSSTPVPHRD